MSYCKEIKSIHKTQNNPEHQSITEVMWNDVHNEVSLISYTIFFRPPDPNSYQMQ